MLHFPTKFAEVEPYLWYISNFLRETIPNIRYEWIHAALSLVVFFPNNEHKFYVAGVEKVCCHNDAKYLNN